MIDSPDNFQFKPFRIETKRFNAILPIWEDLLRRLDIELKNDVGSEINRRAISGEFEEDISIMLGDIYEQIKAQDEEFQRKFITGHSMLQLALLRAKALVAEQKGE